MRPICASLNYGTHTPDRLTLQAQLQDLMEKLCLSCGITKPIGEFGPIKSGSHTVGRAASCQSCCTPNYRLGGPRLAPTRSSEVD